MSKTSKALARQQAKSVRAACFAHAPSPDLIRVWPDLIKARPNFDAKLSIAAYWPMQSEVDIRPLCEHLRHSGHRLALPTAPHPNAPLVFRVWDADSPLIPDQFGAQIPPATAPIIVPDIILVPLLAFTARGERLGYGGGYYDRTLAELRAKTEILACGIAYAGQEVAQLPTDIYDQRLNAVLTEQGLKEFS